jgi:hypothetical protein
MRLRFCDLNYDLYNKGCIDSPLCSCGQSNETLQHYFYECDRYIAQRMELLGAVNNIVSVDVLISGSNDFNEEVNTSVYSATITYISDTHRF